MRQRDPHLTEREVQARLLRKILGAELHAAAYERAAAPWALWQRAQAEAGAG